MNAIPALPVTVNELAELITCLFKRDELRKRMSLFSTSPVYHHNIVSYTTIKNGFCILNASLPSEATRVKTSITFIAEYNNGDT